ncbi:MAG: hypothetical protein ACOY5Y_14980 [Pseudomonadota bacterium]
MTDQPETLAPYRLPWRRDHMKQAGALAPVLRYIPRHPALLIGAAVVGVAGALAWRNREKIKARTAPMIADAREKGQAFATEAKAKGRTAVSKAKAKGESVAAKTRTRRKAKPKTSPAEPVATSVGAAPTGTSELH